MHPLYEPHEDSYLLLKQVPKYAKGDVLDMGTGSGILAMEAASYAQNVLAVDINPLAVKHVHERTQHLKNLTVKQSNLFQHVHGKFDTIFFNAPYLPNDPSIKDPALDGGKYGYEVIDEFLLYARQHLRAGGMILLLFSNLSKPDHIYQTLKTNGYKYKRLSRLKLDFEELYVYEIRLATSNVPGQRQPRHRVSRSLARKKSGRQSKKPGKPSRKSHRK